MYLPLQAKRTGSFGPTLVLLTVTTLINLLLVGNIHAQNRDSVLIFGVTGSDNSGAYSLTMSKIPVQKLLLDVASAPRNSEFLDAALKGTDVTRDTLESLGLVRKQPDANYVLGFHLVTKVDEMKVREVTEAQAQSMAAAFLEHRSEIEAAIRGYQLKSVDSRAVAYILLGCFSLDWDGLNITEEKGYRSVAQTQPNGDRYTPWAREKSDLTLKHLFWGSHNDYEPGVVLTSFGDHFSVPRYSLPDLFTSAPSRVVLPDMPMSMRRKLAGVVGQALKLKGQQIGRLMLALRDGEKNLAEIAGAAGIEPNEAASLTEFLFELDYVGKEGERYYTRVPVFTERDRAMVETVLRIGRRVMGEWLASHYQKIKDELSGISSIRYGVPYERAFTQIWHYIFGSVNRQLIEAGLFANPYADNRKFKGFIPAVWHPSLNPDSLGRQPG